MRKFTYSRQLGSENFTAVEFDSFDEARRAVDKAIHERQLELEKEANEHLSEIRKQPTDTFSSTPRGTNTDPIARKSEEDLKDKSNVS